MRWPLLTAALVLQCWILAGGLPAGRRLALRCVLAAVLGAAEIVLGLEIVGWAGALDASGLADGIAVVLIAQGMAAAIACAGGGTSSVSGTSATLLSCLALWLVATLLLDRRPPMYHDGLTYHLTFAAEWRQRGDLATPFQAYGDQGPTYYPLASSLLYLWSIALEEGDFWARSTQAAGVLLLAAALLSLTRRLGGGDWAALLAILALVSIHPVRHAGEQQGNDILMTAFLLAAVALAAELGAGTWDVAVGFAAAVALAVGTKYIGLAYAPAVVLAAAFIGRGSRLMRGRRLLASVVVLLTALAALAGYAYLRNLLTAGSLIYPAAMSGIPGFRAVGGLPLLPAAFRGGGRSWNSINESMSVAWPVIVVAAIWGAWSLDRARRPHRLEVADDAARVGAALLGIAALTAITFSVAVPYRQSRFLLTSLLVLVPLAAVGLERLPVIAPLGELRAGPLDHVGRLARIAVLLGVIALALQEPGYRNGRYERWARRPVAGTRFGDGWKFLADERARLGRPLRIVQASTHNLPYPLYGSDLRNLVRSVPASGREADLYYRFGSRQLAPFAGVTRASWRRFVSHFRPDYFFSSVRGAEKTFGREDRWAAKDRDLLRLVYADPEVRIYAAAAAETDAPRTP